MDRRTANELAAGGGGMIDLDGMSLLLSSPTDEDVGTLMGELRRLWKKKWKSPLAAVLADIAHLSPELQAIAVKEAAQAQAAGAGRPPKEPDPGELGEQLFDPEAARFWVWLLARRNHPELTLASLKPLVTEANVIAVLAAVAGAVKLDKAAETAAPNSPGAGSSKSG